MAIILWSAVHINKSFYFLVVSSFLHGKMNQGRDLVNIHGLIRLFYRDVNFVGGKRKALSKMMVQLIGGNLRKLHLFSYSSYAYNGL